MCQLTSVLPYLPTLPIFSAGGCDGHVPAWDPASFLVPPQSQVAGLPLGGMDSHLGFSCVIPGALWHAGGEQTQAEGGGEDGQPDSSNR